MNNFFNEDLLLEDKLVLLRVLKFSDFNCLRKIANNKFIWKFYVYDLSCSDNLLKYLEEKLILFKEKKEIPFVIIEKKSNKIVGMTSFLNISFNDKRIEIGWSWIALEYQGEGFNRIVKRILISFVFENLNFERVEFKTDLLNVQARKALSKIGCVEEGILRSHTQMHDGRRRDTVYYSIIRKDWDNKN